MLGLVNYSPTPHSVELRDVPVPEIGEYDVLLAVQAVGICGSDLHQYHGTQSWKVNYPLVLGHEFGGVIAKTGARVKAFKEGGPEVGPSEIPRLDPRVGQRSGCDQVVNREVPERLLQLGLQGGGQRGFPGTGRAVQQNDLPGHGTPHSDTKTTETGKPF